jgi:hypothetical protein
MSKTIYTMDSDAYDAMRSGFDQLKAENAALRELLDFALPIAMYAASTEEGDRIREMMREVEL